MRLHDLLSSWRARSEPHIEAHPARSHVAADVCDVSSRGLIGIVVLGAILQLASPSAALASDDPDEQKWEETDKLPAVQNRKYRVEHEFAAGIGILPTDPYTKGLSLNGGYAWHLSDLWAVEGNFSWIFNFSTSLRDKLEGNFNIPEQRFARINMFGQLGALLKPLYGKFALLNDSQVYGELFFSLYAVVARMEGGAKSDNAPQGQPERMAFGGAPGFGLRGYISRHLSARLNLNWMILVAETGEVHTPLFINLQFALSTRSAP